VASSSSACAAATPVRRARNAVSVSPGRRSGSCGSRPTVAVRGATWTLPLSGASAPDSTCSSVDLPAPFGRRRRRGCPARRSGSPATAPATAPGRP
jgi:hypothetical protein